MKEILVISDHNSRIAMAQREPFLDHKNLLRRRLSLKIEHIHAETFSEIEKICKNQNSNIAFLIPSWRETPKEAEKALKSIRENSPKRKLIFIDPFDQTTSNYFNLVPYVERFLKRECLKDVNEYQHQPIGGSKFTEFIAKQWKADFTNWYVGSEIPEGYQNRVSYGWNLGTATRFKQELFKPKFWFNHQKKNIDIFCRLSLGSEKKQEWYAQYRIAAVEALKPLVPDFKLAVSAHFIEKGLIPRRQYLKEIKRSRIVFSPFGWGESCWRDFEAVCYGCLLIKPSMSHINTNPNIFAEGETYVPVRWDFGDLEEKCRYYLEHPDKANQIIENARHTYKKYFEQEEFVKTVEKLIIE